MASFNDTNFSYSNNHSNQTAIALGQQTNHFPFVCVQAEPISNNESLTGSDQYATIEKGESKNEKPGVAAGRRTNKKSGN